MDVNPQTTFHLAVNEKEYHLIMFALAFVAGAPIKPDGRMKFAAAALNQQMLGLERRAWDDRMAALEKKVSKAPQVDAIDAEEEIEQSER